MKAKIVIFQKRIIVYYKKNDKPLRLGTGLKVIEIITDPPPKKREYENFDLFKGEFNKNEPDYKTKNYIINQKLSQVNEIIRKHWGANNGEYPTANFIYESLRNGKSNEEAEKRLIIDLFNKFLIYLEENKRKEGTLKMYRVLKTDITEIIRQTGKKLIVSVDKEFMRMYELYLSNNQKANMSVIKRIVQFKSFLKWARDENYNIDSTSIKYKPFTNKEYPKKRIHLEKTDLQKLIELKLTGRPERIRDYFIFLCYTGLRWSDFTNISKAQIQNKMLCIATKKTNEKCEIPLNTIALEILEKYKYRFKMAEQEFNREIKNLLEKNEICTHFVVKDKVIQNSTVNKEAPKFKFVSSSTARKTFISLLVKANVPLSYIMACTGHTQIKTVQHYLRVYAEESFTFTESLI